MEAGEFEDAFQGLRIQRSLRGQPIRPGQHAGAKGGEKETYFKNPCSRVLEIEAY